MVFYDGRKEHSNRHRYYTNVRITVKTLRDKKWVLSTSLNCHILIDLRTQNSK